MAYLTELNNRDINTLIYNYKLIDYLKYIPIYEGIQNSNYIIVTKHRKYILTIFEDKFLKDKIIQYFNLMTFLNKNDFDCPSPVKDRNGKKINIINDKPCALVNFLEGEHLIRHKLHHCSQIGRNIANMHNKTSKYSKSIDKRFDINFYLNSIKDNLTEINQYQDNLANILTNEVIKLNDFNIPIGIIHGDLFPDNVLFKNGKITGFIDFYFASNDYLIADIAIVLISWCFYSLGRNNIMLNQSKAHEIIKSYNMVRKVSYDELYYLRSICKIYCIRFFITRLLDYKLQNDSEKVLTKDPKEYINKLLYFINNEIQFEKIIFND